MSKMAASKIVWKALKFATEKHRGMKDKAGAPYISHPIRVATRMRGDDAACVALLHDVIEDCGVSAADLRNLGMNEAVIEAVVLLSKVEGMVYEDYLRAVKANPLALVVKLADIADNSDPDRLARLPDADAARLVAKYNKALAILGGE